MWKNICRTCSYIADGTKHYTFSNTGITRTVKAHANGPIIVGPNNVVTCCVRLHGTTTMLALVAYSLKPVKLLGPCKRTQHCWPTTPNNVGSCWHLLRPFAWALKTHVNCNTKNVVYMVSYQNQYLFRRFVCTMCRSGFVDGLDFTLISADGLDSLLKPVSTRIKCYFIWKHKISNKGSQNHLTWDRKRPHKISQPILPRIPSCLTWNRKLSRKGSKTISPWIPTHFTRNQDPSHVVSPGSQPVLLGIPTHLTLDPNAIHLRSKAISPGIPTRLNWDPNPSLLRSPPVSPWIASHLTWNPKPSHLASKPISPGNPTHLTCDPNIFYQGSNPPHLGSQPMSPGIPTY